MRKISKAEQEYIAQYKVDVQAGKFPVQCITIDPVVFYKGKVLLIKRGGFPGRGLYALPGGFLNFNEFLMDGVLRECYEETNIALDKSWLFDKEVFDDPKRSATVRIITHAFAFHIPTGEYVAAEAGDDAVEVYWVDMLNFVKNFVDKCHEDHYNIVCRFGAGFLKK